jgi:putative membrane protein
LHFYYIKVYLKGILYGLSNIVPGVSSGTTLQIFKLFKPMIHSINNFWDNPRKNIPFLTALILGTVTGAVGFSNFITVILTNFPLATSLFFSGLIFGSVPMIYSKASKTRIKKRYYIPCVLSFLGIVLISACNGLGSTEVVTTMSVQTFIWLFMASAASSAAMVLPGSSSAIVMLMFGAYHTSINANANIVHFTDLKSFGSGGIILIPIIAGMVAGMVLISKLAAYLLHHYYTVTYFSMLGLMMGSVFTLLNKKSLYTANLSLYEIIAAVLLFFIGVYTAYKISNRASASPQVIAAEKEAISEIESPQN